MGGRDTSGKALSWPCGTGRLHLIVSCTQGKSAPPGGTVFPCHLTAPDVALDTWTQQVRQVTARSPTGELYRGLHWQRACAVARRHDRVELWAISAGLGLRHATDPAVPYDATFHRLAYPPATHWHGLTTRPPLPGRCASLAALLQACPQDVFVLALSPVYLRAVEADLCAGLASLADPARQLRIVTSQGYRGPLLPWSTFSHADLLTPLHTNFTALNVSLAAHLVDGLAGSR